jgi:hypothetical protein
MYHGRIRIWASILLGGGGHQLGINPSLGDLVQGIHRDPGQLENFKRRGQRDLR